MVNWEIKGITQFPNSKIFIFDRYGKLLKQLPPNSLGWDGSFNGKKCRQMIIGLMLTLVMELISLDISP